MLRVRERFDPEKRKIIAQSRNLHPVLPFQAGAGAGQREGGERILGAIDIDEPIWTDAGTTRDVQFRYRAGIPQSTEFYIWWFLTLAEADGLYNRLLPEENPILPVTTITPYAPEPDTGEWQSGVVRIEVPASYKPGFVLIGSMIMFQPDVETIDGQQVA